nr:uncharacterized protein LOC109158743 [Ipomoea batatas]
MCSRRRNKETEKRKYQLQSREARKSPSELLSELRCSPHLDWTRDGGRRPAAAGGHRLDWTSRLSDLRVSVGRPHAQPEETTPIEGDGAPASATDPTAETSKRPTWKAGEERAENLGCSRPLGDKYGSWMITQRKPRNYKIKGDPKRNYGRKNRYSKRKRRRFGALESLEEEGDEEAQEEYFMMDTPDGPTCALLSGKGKRPQVQITEAQILNDKTGTNREAAMNKQKRMETRQKCSNSKRKLATTTKIYQMLRKSITRAKQGDLMMDVVFAEGQTSAGVGTTGQ